MAIPRAALSAHRNLLAVPLLALLWGLNWPAVKTVLAEVAPWTLRTTGMGLGALLLFGLACLRGQSLRVPRAHWPRLLAAGVLTVAAFNLLVAFAQLSGSTSRAAIVTFTMPVWAIALAWPVLGERPDARRWAALALGVAGLLILAAPIVRAGTLPAGIVYSLGAGFCWAAGLVFIKRFPVDAAPLSSTAWQLLVGAVTAGIGMLAVEGVPVPKALSAAASVALAFHVVLATALAYFIWFEVMTRLPAGVAALGTLMVPVVGVSSAMWLLGERPSPFDLAGFGLILAAAVVGMKRASAAPAAAVRPGKTATRRNPVSPPAARS